MIDDNDSEEGRGKDSNRGGSGGGGAGGAPGKVADREKRQQERAKRAQQRQPTDVVTIGKDGSIEVAETQYGSRRYHSKAKLKQKAPITLPRRDGKVPITVPISVRTLSEAVGKRVPELLLKLRSLGITAATINSALDRESALLLATDFGIELDIREQQDAEDELLAAVRKAENDLDEEKLEPRPPVVTIMGHVDHGKTSILDRIRRKAGLISDVVSTETGGITQVIRAWRVMHNEKWITFLDTPGHEAFTKMRARGAQVTDIAVIVVAADDGVMPQTEEAINHAKAAGVKIVVAINKVDLPNANVKRAEQQLYGMSLLPDNMGGDTPFVYTSAKTGLGIDDLLEALSLVAELTLELKANPNRPAVGTCLEANLSGDEGVFATLLVQQGTLRKGEVILCGASYGRVRAMYDDMGRSINEASPSVPVRITGLDEVPNADDPFMVVTELAKAREIAEKRTDRAQELAMIRRDPVSLETLGEKKLTELKVILKADFRGSIEAIKKELEKLTHEEVRVRVLHTGIGAITESDVQLALTSPSDTMIVGFNAVPDNAALKLAEERRIPIREHSIIYNLTAEVKSALEGKLKPIEEVVHLGRAVVRDTFKISKIGVIAGCYVTQGTIERSAKVRLIRGGVVIYPPAEKTASLESLKRFKDDVKEVREGFECGLKIAGYDDIKSDDVIEAYRIDIISRKL